MSVERQEWAKTIFPVLFLSFLTTGEKNLFFNNCSCSVPYVYYATSSVLVCHVLCTCVAHFHACSPENREAIIGALDGSRSQFKAALNDVDWAVQTAPFQDSATNGVQIYSCQDEYSDVSAR